MKHIFEIHLVEDDIAQAKLFNVMLKKICGDVVLSTFESGNALITHLSEKKRDPEITPLVISDLNLPDMSGIELLSMLKKLRWGTRLRLILFTQTPEKEIVQQAYEAGAAAILSKPNSLEEFETLLSFLVGFWSYNYC